MSVSAVKNYLAGYGLDGRVQEFSVSSATVELAAQALALHPLIGSYSRAKTLADEYLKVHAPYAGDWK